MKGGGGGPGVSCSRWVILGTSRGKILSLGLPVGDHEQLYSHGKGSGERAGHT